MSPMQPSTARTNPLSEMKGAGDPSIQKLLGFSAMRRVPSDRIEMLSFRQFLTPSECEGLIERIEINRRPSTIADDNGDHAFRTSETCDLDHADPLVAALDSKLTWISGIHPTHGEPLQGQRYGMGQEFKAHTDYFEPGGADFETYCAASGQRTWTFMIYLNNVKAGGGTHFPLINKMFHPERGTLLIWNNRHLDGSVNPSSLHRGMPVRKGVKYIITKWYRERRFR